MMDAVFVLRELFRIKDSSNHCGKDLFAYEGLIM